MWDSTKILKTGDSTLLEVPIRNSDIFLKTTMKVSTINGVNRFKVKILNIAPPYSTFIPLVKYIEFPSHSVQSNAKEMAIMGGAPHDCGSCHNFAWWDTFNEVTITGSKPVEADAPTTPNYSGGIGTISNKSIFIDNKLTNPCLANVLSKMRSARFDNAVQTILSNFDKSQNLGFKIQDFYLSQDPAENATTDNTSKTITLNSFALANASKEFIAKTIYHEILHIYLNTTEESDHIKMANNYVNPIANALMSQFPNLGAANAEALAWSGLYNTKAWDKLPGEKQKSIRDINERFKNLNNKYNHQYGIPC
ncbi:hypothetical protein [Dyadobacter sp. CY356]|uniref:hypothetical protein n=1 Tax=Dyadobacter sp. CY356 TaxID=2906442 RepID=UPI001F2F5AB5|nr:hypothetical protein [Dyadobacter sp. CY356]MCF0056612.1 hypothetical protein [Dyadobacter sp. CY356]